MLLGKTVWGRSCKLWQAAAPPHPVVRFVQADFRAVAPSGCTCSDFWITWILAVSGLIGYVKAERKQRKHWKELLKLED